MRIRLTEPQRTMKYVVEHCKKNKTTIQAEYELVKLKKSTLPARQREMVVDIATNPELLKILEIQDETDRIND